MKKSKESDPESEEKYYIDIDPQMTKIFELQAKVLKTIMTKIL